MKYVSALSLAVIAIVLIAAFFLHYIQPALVLATNEGAYRRAATTCHEAAAQARALSDIPRDINDTTVANLRKSANVALLDCVRKDKIYLTLRNQGVLESELALIDLQAKSQARLPATYIATNRKRVE